MPPLVRAALKRRRITTCDQLLAAAGNYDNRAALAAATQIAPDQLIELVQRADLARVRGTGFVFSQMLRDLYVVDVKILADHKPATLYGRLRRYNRDTGTRSRAPTASEVTDWIEQARKLPKLVTYAPGDRKEAR